MTKPQSPMKTRGTVAGASRSEASRSSDRDSPATRFCHWVIGSLIRHSSFGFSHSLLSGRRFMGRASVGTLGFTLIELMVVVVLIAIMTAVIIPEMKGTYEDALLRSTGRELVGVLNLAYSQTITLSQRHRVRLDKAAGRYFVERAVRESEPGSGFVPVRDVPGGEGKLDTRISIQIRKQSEDARTSAPASSGSTNEWRAGTGTESISFYPDGTAEAGEILLRDRDGFGLALRINPTTARVRIVQLDRE
jgi:type II secretion system protein H